MTTPSETRAGKLRSDEERCESGDPECGPVEFHDSEGVPLCRVCWEGLLLDSAAEGDELPWTPERIQAIAYRVRTHGDEEAAHLIELLNAAGIEAEEEALAASEPVEAVCACDGKMTDGRHWLSCPLSHPAPEQPGKGEAERSVRFHNALWKSLPESVRSHASMLTQVWKTADSTELAEACKAGVLALAAVATPQPSDPAEGDARGMFNLLLQRLRGQLADSTSDFAYVIVRDYANELGDIFNALSTPPTAAVRIDDAAIDRARNAYIGHKRSPYQEGETISDLDRNEREAWGKALTAALDPQVKKQD